MNIGEKERDYNYQFHFTNRINPIEKLRKKDKSPDYAQK